MSAVLGLRDGCHISANCQRRTALEGIDHVLGLRRRDTA
jgi:hypothetical protein